MRALVRETYWGNVGLEEFNQKRFAAPKHGSDLSTPLFLHKQAGRQNDRLIIFVHGLNGSRYTTWGHYPRYVFQDKTDVDVALYGYINGWQRLLHLFSSIPIEREAEVFSNLIRDLPYTEIIIVGHSLGGLLSKSAIADLIDKNETEALAKIRALFLMATPQSGAISRIPLLSSLSGDAAALSRNGSTIERTQSRFRDHVNVDLEHRKDGLVHIPTHAIIAAEDVWVSPLSSGISIKSNMKKVVRGSHTSIVKPSTKRDDCYNWFLGRLTGIAPTTSKPVNLPLREKTEAEKALFTTYDADCEPYYIQRAADQKILAALDDGAVWAVGTSGNGKTTTLARCSGMLDLQQVYVDCSSVQLEPAATFQERVSNKILTSLLRSMGVSSSHGAVSQSEDELLEKVVSHLDGVQRIVYLDEVPLDDEFIEPLATKIYSIITSLRMRGRGDIKFAVSTLELPPMSDGAINRRLRERVRFVVVDDWDESEISRLAETICEQLEELPPKQAICRLIGAAGGNPRIVKSFFRDFYFEPDKAIMDFDRLIETAMDGAGV